MKFWKIQRKATKKNLSIKSRKNQTNERIAKAIKN